MPYSKEENSVGSEKEKSANGIIDRYIYAMCVFEYLSSSQRVTSELCRGERGKKRERRGNGVGGLLTNRQGHRVEERVFWAKGFSLRSTERAVLVVGYR